MKEDLHIHSIQIIHLLLRIINSLFSLSFFPHNAAIPNLIDISEGRSILYIFYIQYYILSIIVDKDSQNVIFPNSIDCNEGRSTHSLNRSLL